MSFSKPVVALRIFVRVLMPILLVAAAAWLAYAILQQPRSSGKRVRPKVLSRVEVRPLVRQDFQVRLRSQGIVSAATQTAIRAEAGGRVLSIHPVFRSGGTFKKGAVLVAIDPRLAKLALQSRELELAAKEADRYQLTVELSQLDSQRGFADRELALQRRRLKRLQDLIASGVSADNELEPMELAALSGETKLAEIKNRRALLRARKKTAEAAVDLAEVQVSSAKLALENTRVIAPYAGRILSRQVEIGQFVSAGAALTTIYSEDRAEVRLPLSSRQLAFLELPEDGALGPKITLIADFGGQSHRWSARLLRVDGAIDAQTRQLFVIASIDKPFLPGPDRRPALRLGAFVRAEVFGRSFSNVHVVPRTALRGGSALFLVKGQSLRRQPVDLIWADAEQAVIGEGIGPQDRLCITRMVFGGDALKVEVIGDAKPGKKTDKASGQRVPGGRRGGGTR